MKRKTIIVILIVILIIVGTLLMLGFTNKTFFRNYYEVTNKKGEEVKIPLPMFSYYEKSNGKYNVTFNTIRSAKNIRNILNKYVENLQACYDEGYFYDADLDITISKFSVENGFPFNKIYLTYDYGNYCENEFVLDNDWKTKFVEESEISEIVINKCIMENNEGTCSDKDINKSDVIELLNSISEEKRIENKNNIGVDETISHYAISVYYVISGKGYTLVIFNYNNYLAFKVIDIDDHSKNAIYNIDKDINKLFSNIYSKY